MDLKSFKEKIRSKLKVEEFKNEELFNKWKEINVEQDKYGSLYKPRNKLTIRGFKKICPNDGEILTYLSTAKQWGMFGLWEYIILSCPKCEYEYAKKENVKVQH